MYIRAVTDTRFPIPHTRAPRVERYYIIIPHARTRKAAPILPALLLGCEKESEEMEHGRYERKMRAGMTERERKQEGRRERKYTARERRGRRR